MTAAAFDACAPSDPRPPTSGDRPRIAISARWQEWAPIVALWHREHALTTDLTPILRDKHARWLSILFAARIRMDTIRRLVLDDPCLPDAILRRRMEVYLSNRKRKNA
jgi:hypothetical protein